MGSTPKQPAVAFDWLEEDRPSEPSLSAGPEALDEEAAPVSSTQAVASVVAGGSEAPSQPVARVALRSRSSQPPPMELSVLLVDRDRVQRSMLARDFVRERWAVAVADEVDDVPGRRAPPERVDVVIVDAAHPDARAILAAVLAANPEAGVVVLAASRAAALTLLEAMRPRSAELRPRDARAGEVVESVRRVVKH